MQSIGSVKISIIASVVLKLNNIEVNKSLLYYTTSRGDRLCGLVVRIPGHRSRGSGLIPGATRFSEK
jgi:hypothetical protein